MLRQMFNIIGQLYFARSMLSTMQQIGCDLQAWFHYRLRFATCIFFVSSAHGPFEKRKGKEFVYMRSYLRLINGGNFTVWTNIVSYCWVQKQDKCTLPQDKNKIGTDISFSPHLSFTPGKISFALG